MKLTKKFKRPTFLLGSALLLLLLRWPLLQGIAWLGMIVSYSKSHGLRSGFEMTFSGAYPCPICLAVKAGVGSEAALLGSLIQNPGLYAMGPLVLFLLAGLSLLKSFRPINDSL